MGLILLTLNQSMFLVILCVLWFSPHVHAQPNVFNLIHHGGRSARNFDNSKALVSAWSGACKWAGRGEGEAQVLLPQGVYYSNPVELSGPCRGPIRFTNKGRLVAPTGPTNLEHWIQFRYVDGLTVDGGTFLGQGATAWNRPGLVNPAHSLMRLAFVKNAKIQKVNLIKSKKVHLHLFGCSNVDISQVTIISPETSPNTDGIKIGKSDGVRIHDTSIASGDDCVAILTGTTNLNVTRVRCGPGHGVSIGSLGTNQGEEVRHVTVQNCTFVGTQNGVRIKSKTTPNSGVVDDVTFRDIIIDRAQNPIIIDQNYCPPKNCPKGNSRVQIKGVRFENINGTSATEVAVKLECSRTNPCQGIRLARIDLSYVKRGVPTTAFCANAHGVASGFQRPKSCF